MRIKKLSKNAKNDIANLIILLFVALMLWSPFICLVGGVWLSGGF